MNIHPTAIVDPRAELDGTVEVGPYSVIDADTRIGAACRISSCVRIYAGTTLGRGNQVDHGVVLGGAPQDAGFDADTRTRLEIGDHNIFREGVNLSRASSPERVTSIGNHNMFMCMAHAGHDCSFGDHNVFGPGAAVGGHVHIGSHVFVSGLVAVHQFCHIGDYAMIAGCAKIVKDVPHYATADGNPARIIGINSIGLRRAGMPAATRAAIKEAYRAIYRAGMNVSQGIESLRSQENCEEVASVIRFFEDSERGVTGHR